MDDYPDKQLNHMSEARCREQLAELDRIFKSSPVGLAVIDRTLKVVRINEHMAEMTGKPEEEHIGHTLDEIAPDVAEQLESIFMSIIETGEPVLDVEITGFIPKTSEGPRHWLSSYFPLRSETGEIAGILAAVMEITELKHTQQALLLTQFVVEHAPDAVFWIDKNARFVYVNDTARKSLGYSREELLQMGVGDIDPIFPMDQWSEIWEQNKAQGSITFETLYKTKEGRVFPVEIRTNFIESGGQSLNCAYARDISERKQAQEALLESSQMLKLVLDTIPVPVWWKDKNGVYLGTNRLNAQNAGLSSPEEMVGKTDLEMPWGRNEAEKYRADDKVVLDTGVPKLNYEETLHTADGRIIHLETSKVPLRDAEGEIIGVLGTFEDISERKRAEEALRKTNRTLAALSRVNEILVRATEESELLQKACEVVVETGGYLMVWVGFAMYDEEKTVRPAAHAGYEDGYLDQIKVSWADNVFGRGPTGNAIRTGKLCVVEDVVAEPSYEVWREEAIKRGYRCSAALPLMVDDKVLGAMNFYRAEPGCIDPAEEELLSQLASDLSYGITSLRARNENARTEAERRALEQKLEEHKRKFYRETILSVTDGKLDICDAPDVEPYISNAEITIDVKQPPDVSSARRKIGEFCRSHGLNGEELHLFTVGVCEAINNALKHGLHGTAYAGKTDDEVWVAVKDEGLGIESLILPRAVLLKGFSTKPSLGLGYSIMLEVADRILLSTGTSGTTVVLIKSLHKEPTAPLDAIPDTWAGIPDKA
jgi:PAS domain S-box-containing protein